MPETARRRRRERFDCPQCGRPTSAPIGTTRLAQRLCSPCFGTGKDRRPRDLNDLEGRDWAQASRSVMQYPDTRSEKQRQHGAAFPQILAEQQIEIYTKRGAVVLDPFVGVGTTLDACQRLGRRGVGIDLSRDYLDLAQQDLDAETQRLILDDARNMLAHIAPGSVDFLLTSPPYGDLLKNVKGTFAHKWQEHSSLDAVANPRPYSDDPQDLGNLSYDEFLEAIAEVFAVAHRALKPKSYAAWVVKDFRALRHGVPYVNLHGDIAAVGSTAGFTLWDIRIYDQTRFRPLVCLGFPSRNFYLNMGHSYIVIFKRA